MLTAPQHSASDTVTSTPVYGWAPYSGHPGSRSARWPLLAAAWTVLAVGLWACRDVLVDDAFITYRYAANLAAGYGPTWNPGEDPVEGYTNFAWMALHAPFAWAGMPLPVVSKLAAAACAAWIVWMLVREPATRVGAVVAAGSFLVFLPTFVHVMSGLETAAVGAVLLRAVVLAARVVRAERMPAPWELPALLLLAGLLRPEGVAAVAPALLVWLHAARRDRQAWSWTVAAALLGAAYMAWRWSYFGHPLPNTFYVKAGLDAVTSGKWLQVTTALLLPLLVLACALLLHRPPSLGILVLATAAAMWVVPALTLPAMDYMSRFAWHAVPVLCLAAGWVLDTAEPRRSAALFGVVTLMWLGAAGVLHADARSMVNYGGDLDEVHGAIGRGLAAADIPAGARTLATSDAGAIPYYSGWSSIDYIGLNDEPIAHGAPTTDRVRAAASTVIVVTSDTVPAQPVSHGLDVPAATGGYVQVAAGPMRADYWQLVFAKPEWAAQVAGPVTAELVAAEAAGDGRNDTGFRRWLARNF